MNYELFTLELKLKDEKEISAELKNKWHDIYENVKDVYDIPKLIFIAEMISVIDNNNDCVFQSKIYSSVDMFSGREQRWILKTKKIKIHREIHQEINESWQHVEVFSDILNITGLPDKIFIDWNGDFSNLIGEFEIKTGNINKNIVNEIIKKAEMIFNNVQLNIIKSDRLDKLKSEAKRNAVFTNNNLFKNTDDELIDLCILLTDQDYDISIGALNKIKTYQINNNNIDLLIESFKNAFIKGNNVLKINLADYLGSLDNRFFDVLKYGLKYGNESVIEETVKSFGRLKNTDIIPDIIQLLQSISFNIRWACISALQKLTNNDNPDLIINTLIPLLYDENHNVKSAAIGVLSLHKDNKLVDPFIDCLEDNNDYIKQTAAISLGELGDKKAIEPLKKLLDNCYDKNIIKFIKSSIKKLEKNNTTVEENRPHPDANNKV